MGDSASLDDLFRAAVSAIDAGDIPELSRHLIAHPSLISDRLETPGSWLRDKVGNALVNGNFAAAAHLVDRGTTLTLSTALCLERWDDVDRLGAEATLRQKQFALTLAVLKGKTEALRRIIALGADVTASARICIRMPRPALRRVLGLARSRRTSRRRSSESQGT